MMFRLGLYLLGFATFVQCDAGPKHRRVDVDFLKKQVETMLLYFHVEEPNHVEKCNNISETWVPSEHTDNFNNISAVKDWTLMYSNNLLLPRHVPFSALEKGYTLEVQTLFNMLHSAKDYATFYKTAVYVRDRTNEDLFIYVLTALILHRLDLQDMFIPPLYEVLSEYYNNGEVINIAHKINVLGESVLRDHHSVYKRDNNFIIKWNNTAWPYYSKSASLTYFTQDPGLSLFYYYFNMGYPSWLGSDVVSLDKDGRGEWFWFVHKQIFTRYYMERLSNGLGEIEDLDGDVVEEGYNSGLVYPNGIPFPTRPNYFNLKQPAVVQKVLEIKENERRIRNAIDIGFFIDGNGKQVDIRSEEAIDVLGNLIQANVDSPNLNYYKDFISMWKSMLGNSVSFERWDEFSVPFVLPSALEHYQTAPRDPAFFMIWKRVLKLFASWQQTLNPYKFDELILPGVAIENVEVDELVTYFDYSYMNISAVMPMNEKERKWNYDDKSILVQYPRLNHQEFGVRIRVNSEVAKKVAVIFGMAPKYDGRGREIPLHENWQNVFYWDQFIYELPKGESVIVRKSINNHHTAEDWNVADDVYQSGKRGIRGQEQFYFDKLRPKHLFPRRLLLPKGTLNGMPFVFMVYITEYRPPQVSYASNFHSKLSCGYGSGSRRLTRDPLGFPFNKPLDSSPFTDIQSVRNLYIRDVVIRHKPSSEVYVPFLDNSMLNFPRVHN